MNNTKYRTMCIVNPIAGNKRGRQRWNALDTTLREAGFEYEVNFTTHALHATDLTRNALQNGYNRIVAVGGDGTLNEVVNGFYTNNGRCINPTAGLMLIPAGTGSDFARMLNLDASAASVLRLMGDSVAHNCDVVRTTFCTNNGEKSSRYFINIADVGIGSETCARVNQNSKVMGGFWSFLLAALYTIITYRNRCIKISLDDVEIFAGKCCVVAVGNGRFFGGGMKIAPQALIDDGLLDVVMVKDFGKLELFANIAKVYRGAHLTHPKVEFRRGMRVKIESGARACVELDGEPLGYGDIEFEVIAGGMNILV
jgi:diacylglycerol kinase (ATP)